MLPRVAPFHAIPIRPPVYSCARKLAEIIRPWTAGTSGSLDGGGAGLAARVPGPAQFLDVRKISPGPDNRPCLESASPGQAEPALVLVSVGFRLRGCGILHCRFAGRRTSRSVSTSGGTPDEPFSPAAAEAEAASDQRPSRNSYLPCVRPFRNSVRIESSLISRSSSVAARPSISCTLDRLVEERPSRRGQADIIRLLLLTGCRRGEILRLKWSEVDGPVLRLAETKTGPRQVWLSEAAQAIIAHQPRTGSAYVFPSPKCPARPWSSAMGLWYRARKEAGIDDVRLHDLRHTVARPGRGPGCCTIDGGEDARTFRPDDDPALRSCQRSGG